MTASSGKARNEHGRSKTAKRGVHAPSDADIADGQVMLSLEAHKEHCSVVVDGTGRVPDDASRGRGGRQ
ncbi:MAG: hypothetical protein U5L09_07160 [Bacteroidales bacterium]|nr:hypothetical protein [Bacteroidales bacterium]